MSARLLLTRLILAAILLLAVVHVAPAEAQRRRLATPLCAIVRGALTCFDARGRSRVISTVAEQVTDVAIAPDGQWVVYRGYVQDDASIRIASLFGGQSADIGTQAVLPADLRDEWVTLAWSPDGLTIAYVVANGLRVAVPTLAGAPRLIEINDRQYVDVRFSPGGARLAAKSADGGWTLFEITQRYTDETRLNPLRTLTLSADLAWQDEATVVIAPESGGLYRLAVADTNAQYVAITSVGFYARLVTLPDGSIRALNTEPGRGFSTIVSLAADGTLSPVSDRPVDPRVRWVQQGRRLLYITSGTPIVIDPVSGDENTLPIQAAERVEWMPVPIDAAATVGLDADLYFLAPDPLGMQQVWRLLRTGNQPAQQLTALPGDVTGYAVNPSRTWLAVVSDRQLNLLRLGEAGLATVTPTARPFSGTPSTDPAQSLATLQRRGSVALSWSPDSTLIAFTDDSGVFTVRADGSSAPQPVLANAADSSAETAVFSPDGAYLLVKQSASAQSQFVVVALRGGVSTFQIPALQAGRVDRVLWAAGNLNRLGLLLTQTASGSSISLITPEGQQLLAQFPTAIIDAGYAQNVTTPALLFLSRVGWSRGPDVVQLFTVASDGLAQGIGPPLVLDAPVMSPTGRLAFSLTRVDDEERINQIIIADLQKGLRIAIDSVANVSDVKWVF